MPVTEGDGDDHRGERRNECGEDQAGGSQAGELGQDPDSDDR